MAAVTLNTASPVQLQAAQRGATVLRIDAVYTELIGLSLLLGGEGMAEALGLLPIGLYNLLGVGMFLYGIGLWVATSRWMGVGVLRAQIAANVVWLVATEALLLLGIVPFTGLGIGVLIVANLIVITLTVLQWRAANRLA